MLCCQMQECGAGKLMLYGGMGTDGKPLNDAWVLDLEKPSWSLIYWASSDLCPPQVQNVPTRLYLQLNKSALPDTNSRAASHSAINSQVIIMIACPALCMH